MLSEDIKNMADQYSYYGEKAASITFSQDSLLHLIHMLRDFQTRAKQLEMAQIAPHSKQPEINKHNCHNVIFLGDAVKNPKKKGIK